MVNTKNEQQCAVHDVNICSLVEKSRIEIAENTRKMYSNVNKATKDVEPFENTAFLELIEAVMNVNI